jgi:hypothetical protein
LVAFAFALVGVPATVVHANEPVVLEVDGHLCVEVGGYVSVPNGPMTREFNHRLTGWSFQFGMGLSGIPATLGLAGALSYLEPSGSRVGGQQTYSFSIVQPSFRSIEPFLLIGLESRSPR